MTEAEGTSLVPLNADLLRTFTTELATAFVFLTRKQALPLLPTPENIELCQKYEGAVLGFFDLSLGVLRTPSVMRSLLNGSDTKAIWYRPDYEASIYQDLSVSLRKTEASDLGDYYLIRKGFLSASRAHASRSSPVSLDRFKKEFLEEYRIDEEEADDWNFVTEMVPSYRLRGIQRYSEHHLASRTLRSSDFVNYPRLITPFLKGVCMELSDIRERTLRVITKSGEEEEILALADRFTKATEDLRSSIP